MIGAIKDAWRAIRSARGVMPAWKRWNSLRTIRAALEAAQKRDDLWTLADFKDADASLLPEIRRLLRARSRYEYSNNPIVARVVDVWVGDVVGEAGPALQVHCGHTRVDRFIERAWDRWWRHSNQASKLRVGVKAEAVDGEAVGVLTSNDRLSRRQSITVDVIGVEADRLASPDWSNANRSDYVDGVHLDPATREPTAYDLLKAHPGTEYLDKFAEMWDHEEFPREQVLHAFRRQRPEQNRGVSRYVPVLPLSGLHRKYMEAETNRNVLRAAFSFVVKSMAPPGTGDEPSALEAQWWQEMMLPNRQGAGLFLPDGYDVTQMRPDGSAGELTAFHEIIGGVVAGCFTMPLGRALGKYASASYPGVRAEMLPYHKAIATDRYQVWEPQWMTPLYDAFLDELLLTGEWSELLDTLAEDPEFTLDLLDCHEIEWHWPEKELVVDPSREENSRKLRLSMGLSDREREMDSVDLDERDRRAAWMLGVVDADGKPDLPRYRRMLAQSIMGFPVPEPTAQQTGAAPENSGEFGNLGRRQWQNNRKAMRDVLQEVMDGTTSDAAALQMLQSLGLPEARAQALLNDVRDNSLDDPELQDPDDDPPLDAAESGLAAAWLQATSNCGTGDGGFQPGNQCGGDGSGGSGDASGPRKVRVQATPEAKQQMQTLGLTSQQVTGLAGESDGAVVSIAQSAQGLEVRSRHPDYTSHRTIRRDSQGELTIINQEFRATRQGEGTGTRNLLSQVEQAEKLGVRKIVCLAERDTDVNGYYSWPRMGFDAPIPAHLAHQFPASAKQVSDLMRSKQGRTLWADFGEGIRMEFDVRAGSKSRKTLTEYASSRKIEAPSSDIEVSE